MDDIIIVLIICIIVAIVSYLILSIPARIASNKGYSYLGFLLFGIFCFPAALIVALIIDDKNVYDSEKDKAEALLTYKKLLDEGAITKEEFEEKKREYMC